MPIDNTINMPYSVVNSIFLLLVMNLVNFYITILGRAVTINLSLTT